MSIQAMISSIRNNQELLTKRTFKTDKKELYREENSELVFKKLPKEELEILKNKIVLKAKKERRIYYFLVFIIITLCVLPFMYLLLN
ncbi:hypothetical protein T190115A13A_110097 [Tenacibaculum sp. 190524A02b]|uniref:Uncharacterized protein n=1 Tax=Tenacibaculum vairaonense TaxID=3137860 RepID=A0ABM9PH78_9FLAO